MSADNGYVVQKNARGKFTLQMYFASAESYPDPEKAGELSQFDTIEETVAAYNRIDCGPESYPSEYGLCFSLPNQ